MALGACSFLADDTSMAFVSPDKFDYHSCEQLETQLRTSMQQEEKLKALTERASQEPAGVVIGAAAYRTDYLRARGEQKLIREVQERKKCAAEAKPRSGGTVPRRQDGASVR
jgi:hypothetical protein